MKLSSDFAGKLNGHVARQLHRDFAGKFNGQVAGKLSRDFAGKLNGHAAGKLSRDCAVKLNRYIFAGKLNGHVENGGNFRYLCLPLLLNTFAQLTTCRDINAGIWFSHYLVTHFLFSRYYQRPSNTRCFPYSSR